MPVPGKGYEQVRRKENGAWARSFVWKVDIGMRLVPFDFAPHRTAYGCGPHLIKGHHALLKCPNGSPNLREAEEFSRCGRMAGWRGHIPICQFNLFTCNIPHVSLRVKRDRKNHSTRRLSQEIWKIANAHRLYPCVFKGE